MNKENNLETINEKTLITITEFYKILSDPTRMKIIYLLCQKELCVKDISNLIDMGQTAVSYQLRILKDARIAKNKRQGKKIIYSINDQHVADIITTTIVHMSHEAE